LVAIAAMPACSVYGPDLLKDRGAGGADEDATTSGRGGQGQATTSTTMAGSGGSTSGAGSGGNPSNATTGTRPVEAGPVDEAGGAAGSGGSSDGDTKLGDADAGADAQGAMDAPSADMGNEDTGRVLHHPVCEWGECKLVFVSSSAVTADGGSARELDNACQKFAHAQSLPGEWKAWASDATIMVAAKMARSTVPYRLLDGSTIANDWNDLTSGTLRHPIDVREDGSPSAPVEIWTGTSVAGSGVASLTCNNWTATYGTAIVGQSDMATYAWTYARQQYCSAPGVHLYCFEQ
jgi:hypothetical protein